jgi:enamine deaminase RidA (YjgF/YER057c/UK114 family)
MAYPNVKFSYTPGFATYVHDNFHESQVVQIGDRLDVCGTGQFTFHPDDAFLRVNSPPEHTNTSSSVGSNSDGTIPEDRDEQIENIFKNIDECIRFHMRDSDPDLKNGWDRVISIRSYHMDYEETVDEVLEKMTACLKKYCPNHCPIWMTVGVKALAMKEMKVAAEVSGYAGK